MTSIKRAQSQGEKTQWQLTHSEKEAIYSIFQFFDTDGSGTIDLQELAHLQAKLGEPLTDKELELAMETMTRDKQAQDKHRQDPNKENKEQDPNKENKENNKDKSKQVATFDQFLAWWILDHSRADRYASRFQLLRSAINLSESKFEHKKLEIKKTGGADTLEYRCHFYYNGHALSPWHDIPLFIDRKAGILNFVCEIPKWTRAKFEIATGEKLNPIKQDTKNGKLRYYKHGDMMFNYGAFPQTWEDPEHISNDTGAKGDNDPLDVLDIGYKQIPSGSVVAVKVLGVLALIDDGETDWKVIVINISDPLANIVNDIGDVEEHIPGAISAIREYLRIYKVVTGSEPNTFALGEKAMNRAYALKVVEETHEFWQQLVVKGQKTVHK